MNSSEESLRIHKQLSLILNIFFISVIIIAFREYLWSVLSYFFILPVWWFISCLSCFIILFLYSLDKQRQKIMRHKSQLLHEEYELNQLKDE